MRHLICSPLLLLLLISEMLHFCSISLGEITNRVNSGEVQRFVLALPTSLIRSQETWHNSLAVRPATNQPSYSWDNVSEKSHSKWLWNCVSFSGIWTPTRLQPNATLQNKSLTLPRGAPHCLWLLLVTEGLSESSWPPQAIKVNQRQCMALFLRMGNSAKNVTILSPYQKSNT